MSANTTGCFVTEFVNKKLNVRFNKTNPSSQMLKTSTTSQGVGEKSVEYFRLKAATHS
jgi:hypothetical protein